MTNHPMAQPLLEWIEVQDEPIPSDGRSVLVALPMADDDACYAAAFINDQGDLESLCGGEISFQVTHWALLSPPATK